MELIPVTINDWEYKAAVDCGNMRMATSNAAGWNNASVQKRTYAERLADETLGVCGEIALCKYMNWYWSPSVNTFHAIPDVGVDIEVRASAKTTNSLIVRDNDADDRWYVGVFGEPPEMYIAGRIRGSDAKVDKWLRNPRGHRPAWFVPQFELMPLPNSTLCRSQ